MEAHNEGEYYPHKGSDTRSETESVDQGDRLYNSLAPPQDSITASNYLENKVFPVLVPALEQLLRVMQPQHTQDSTENTTMRPITAPQPLPSATATGKINPILWLAQYLARHNPNKEP